MLNQKKQIGKSMSRIQLYNKYKKEDTLNESILIHYKMAFGVFTLFNILMRQRQQDKVNVVTNISTRNVL